MDTDTGMVRTKKYIVEIQDNGIIRDTNDGWIIGRINYKGGSAIDYLENTATLSTIDTDAIRAEARAGFDELLEALDGVIDFAEDWHEHYCAMWGERRKEQQDAMLGAILKARSALAEKEEQDGR